jgi:hypothetical protein
VRFGEQTADVVTRAEVTSQATSADGLVAVTVNAAGIVPDVNLGDACRHDHRLKHEGGWQLHQPEPGPHGRRWLGLSLIRHTRSLLHGLWALARPLHDSVGVPPIDG